MTLWNFGNVALNVVRLVNYQGGERQIHFSRWVYRLLHFHHHQVITVKYAGVNAPIRLHKVPWISFCLYYVHRASRFTLLQIKAFFLFIVLPMSFRVSALSKCVIVSGKLEGLINKELNFCKNILKLCITIKCLVG